MIIIGILIFILGFIIGLIMMNSSMKKESIILENNMSNFNIEQIRQGLRHCLVDRNCSLCPYYIWYYNDDINEPGDRSCWGILYKDADLALQRFFIMNDSGVD